MKIEVVCFLNLSQYSPADGEYPLSQDLTVGDLLDGLGIPSENVRTVFVNGLHAPLDQPLAENDRMFIVPDVAGG